MSDIATAERRLSAALDRIDYLLDHGPRRQPAPDAAAVSDLAQRLAAAEAENERLSRNLSDLRDQQAAQPSGDEGTELARLYAANEELAATNRALIEARSGDEAEDGASIAALEAEIHALRAARAAEMAQLAEIMAELERLLAADGGERG